MKTNPHLKPALTTTVIATVLLLVINWVENRSDVYIVFFILLLSPVLFLLFWLWRYVLQKISAKIQTIGTFISSTLCTFLVSYILLMLMYSISTDNDSYDPTQNEFPHLLLFVMVLSVSVVYGASKWYFERIKKRKID